MIIVKKTFITNVPNQAGAFLKASQCLAALGVNITRVSYNKAVDSHTLFIGTEGTPEQLGKAEEELTQIGYLQSDQKETQVVLLEFDLQDVPGSVANVLELIHELQLNISYISSHNGKSENNYCRMGLFVDDPTKLEEFMNRVQTICKVRLIDYNQTEKIYDNSIFYSTFVSQLARTAGIPEEKKHELMVNINLAMQMLDEVGQSPYRTFDGIARFAELLVACRGEAFVPRISRHTITDQTELILIEPNCGSNTAIIRSGDEVLFVDTGYACYRQEMERIFREFLPNYDKMRKVALITHPDLDHCGLLPYFDEVIASEKSAECLRLEYEGKNGFRERIAMHKPYVRMCKLMTSYMPPDPNIVRVLWPARKDQQAPLEQIGFFEFGDLHFEVFEGNGGHVAGEIVLIDYDHHIAFTGDIFINLHGLTPEQKEYNQYAPILMTSVDTDKKLCAAERKAIMQRLGIGDWRIFGAHGYVKEYNVGKA